MDEFCDPPTCGDYWLLSSDQHYANWCNAHGLLVEKQPRIRRFPALIKEASPVVLYPLVYDAFEVDGRLQLQIDDELTRGTALADADARHMIHLDLERGSPHALRVVRELVKDLLPRYYETPSEEN